MRGEVFTVEIVRAEDLKKDDYVLWSSRKVRVIKVEGSKVWLFAGDYSKPTEFVHYYRVIDEKVVFT